MKRLMVGWRCDRGDVARSFSMSQRLDVSMPIITGEETKVKYPIRDDVAILFMGVLWLDTVKRSYNSGVC